MIEEDSCSPNTVPRATVHTLNPQMTGAGSDGDAIIAGLNISLYNGDPCGTLNMNAIGVGAALGGYYVDTLQCHAIAAEDDCVEEFAIDRCDTIYCNVL